MANMKKLEDNAEEVYFRLGSLLREALPDPAPVLKVNYDGLVLEFTGQLPSGSKVKYYEKVARFEK